MCVCLSGSTKMSQNPDPDFAKVVENAGLSVVLTSSEAMQYQQKTWRHLLHII